MPSPLVQVSSFLSLALVLLMGHAICGGEVRATLLGEPEVVFRYATDRCEDFDIPDTPVRAFVDGAGQVVVLSSSFVNYRNRGPSLSTVRHDCHLTYASHGDPEQFHARYAEWIHATYTPDGQEVQALVHAEWYATLVQPGCESNHGWVNALTRAESHDGGQSYTQPRAYQVWVSPVRWRAEWPCAPLQRTRYGASGPSNILERDGAYYALYTHWADPIGYATETRTCVMRTTDFLQWEVWTDHGWSVKPNVVCKVVAQLNPDNVTWNTDLGSYLLLGGLKGTDRWFAGVYYQLSQDLLTWTSPHKLLDEDHVYAALLDETTGNRNFEVTGQMPYLYWTRFNGGLDRDLLRQQLRLEQNERRIVQTGGHGHGH